MTVLLLVGVMASHGAVTRVRGVVVDSISGAGIPYAALQLDGTERGTLTDADGRFEIETSLPFTGLTVNSMGYTSKSVKRERRGDYVIELVPTGVLLEQVDVRPGKEHYSKKDNPAVELMQRIRRGGESTDPRRNPYYKYDKYERITLALNNFETGLNEDSVQTNALVRHFPELKDHIDTSAITGRPILNVVLREKASQVNYRKEPAREREHVLGLRNEGIDGMLDPEATRTLYEDVLREIDVYDDDIPLMQNRFVSPLSRIGPDFYKYYLADTVVVGGDSCVSLLFVPHNPRMFGFVGRIYVPKNDTTMMVKRIVMNVPANINLNFVNSLRIIQEFEHAPDGSRLKTLDDMIVEAGITSRRSDFYARRVTSLNNHSFEPPEADKIFDYPGPVMTDVDAEVKDEEFWSKYRTVKIAHGENSINRMLQRMRRHKVFLWGERVVRLLVTGYIHTDPKRSRYDIGPVNTMLSFNELEGARFRLGGMTTAFLSPRFFSKQYVAWGTRDHRWKYMVELEYSFHDKKYHAREFPIHSLRLTHLYDVDMLGQDFQFTNPDNIFLSLRRASDTMMAYHRVTKLEYTLELLNNLSFTARLQHERMEQSPYIKFFNGMGEFMPHYDMTGLTLGIRYAPGEKFFQTKTGRLPVNLDAPTFQLTHTFAPKGIPGNRWAMHVTEASYRQRYWFSSWGYIDLIVKGGHVWTRTPWPQLLIPNANLSFTIQPEAFALMNPLEFINDSYLSWDLTYWANGAIFNYIPLLNRLKWREAFGFRGIWGHLSDRNNPMLDSALLRFPPNAFTQTMTAMPYMEVSFGIDNIFKVLRVDYTWRLTYRDSPMAPRNGLQIALHFTF